MRNYAAPAPAMCVQLHRYSTSFCVYFFPDPCNHLNTHVPALFVSRALEGDDHNGICLEMKNKTKVYLTNFDDIFSFYFVITNVGMSFVGLHLNATLQFYSKCQHFI